MATLSVKWPSHLKETKKLKELQTLLSKKVKILPLKSQPSFIAGVDCAFLKDSIVSAASLFTFPDIKPVEDVWSIRKNRFPYIPGLLSFREGPAVISALRKLKKKPDLVIFDGAGIAHPRFLGIASHVGIALDIPSIGCAKSRLIGVFKEPGGIKGEWSHLVYKGRTVGCVLRTRDNVKPVFISPGHRINTDDSIRIILKCLKNYRLPEPIRRADMLTKKIKKEIQ